MAYEAKIVLDSMAPSGFRLTTFELTYPRFVHAELMTHRMFSRNSASSRAIPTEKLLERIENDPVEPVWWGKNQAGMQAREELEGGHRGNARARWLEGSVSAVDLARDLNGFGLHKQIANRVVEPWMWITVLVTATHWTNFFALRRHADAQPEIKRIADMAGDLYASSTPQTLAAGEWHLPLVTGKDENVLRTDRFSWDQINRISVGRCARVSFLTHNGARDPNADVELCDRLLKSGHMSPFEHVARALSSYEWGQFCETAMRDWRDRGVPPGNFAGWHQYRKGYTGEHEFQAPACAQKPERCAS